MMESEYPLVDTSWLQSHLNDPNLVVFDSTVYLHFPNGFDAPYVLQSGRDEWMSSHIPGARFVDLIDEISDPAMPEAFTMIPAKQFCDRMNFYGVNDESTVVVYSKASLMWATRVWWMLRSVGFDKCYVLDGGFKKWEAENRPTSNTPPDVNATKGVLTPRPRPSLWATKDEVMSAIGSLTVCTINALPSDVYTGDRDNYGRRGHIPGSISVPYNTLIDPEAKTFLPKEALRQATETTGAYDKERVICYCGGGISATMDALALYVSGHKNIAVYDGSMTEWAKDEDAPLVLGDKP